MSKLAKTFGKTNEAEGISNSFIYNIRRDFSLFALEDNDSLLGKEEILELLTAEYLRSRAKGNASSKLTKDKIQPLMDDLLEICTRYYRDDNSVIKERQGLNINGALLIKFLARRWHR
jgi:hypothetical protein